MKLAGVDLAWQSEKNPTAIAYGHLKGRELSITSLEPAVYGIDRVFSSFIAASVLVLSNSLSLLFFKLDFERISIVGRL